MNGQTVIDKVREIAAANPLTTYEPEGQNCSYLSGECSNGSTGCLVGQALAQLEVNHGCDTGLSASQLLASLGIDGRLSVTKWLDCVQQYQDKGIAWGLAVSETDRE